jgi:hypothetical protein
MTHDELLARIKEGQWVDKDEMHLRSNALRSVVELHKNVDGACWECQDAIYHEYPCPTIRAIEKELG